jgi:hypothetical protein
VLNEYLGEQWNDALRGYLFGVSIGVNLMGVRLGVRQRPSRYRAA